MVNYIHGHYVFLSDLFLPILTRSRSRIRNKEFPNAFEYVISLVVYLLH